MNHENIRSGAIQKAPENFLNRDGIQTVASDARQGRRDFMRTAFAAAAASAGASAALAQGNPVPSAGGDPNILNLPEHSKGLGQGVATDGYGKPSRYEANVQRRQSPGLTQTTQSSVSRTSFGGYVWSLLERRRPKQFLLLQSRYARRSSMQLLSWRRRSLRSCSCLVCKAPSLVRWLSLFSWQHWPRSLSL